MKVILTAFSLLSGASLLSAATFSDRLDSLEDKVSGMEKILRELAGQPNFQAPRQSNQLGSMIRYQIRSGDSYWSIARRHNISVSALERANPGVNHRALSIGKLINVPGENSSHTHVKNNHSGTYQVKQGDILGRISEAHGIRLRQLLDANPGLNPRRLKIGTLLTIPGRPEAAPALPKERPSPFLPPVERIPPPAEEPDSRPNPFLSEIDESTPEIRELDLEIVEPAIEEPYLITVNQDLRLSQIAELHKTTVAQINKLNKRNLSPNQMIKEGSQLYISSR